MLKWAHCVRKHYIGLLCPNMEIRPRAPRNGIFQIFFIFVERSPDFASNEPSTTPQTLSLSQVMQENLILAYYAQIWKFGPGLPKMEFFKFFLERSPDFASNEPSTTPQTLSLSQVMQENLILVYAQIWKFGPGLPKMEFFKFFSFLWKGLQISLLTSPQPPPDIKFKSSYARKRDYAQIWKFSPRLPKWNFSKKFFFWKDLQISLPTSPQPPSELSLSQVMQKNVVLAYYAQIWKIGPRLPKIEFFKKNLFFRKGLQISLLTNPQPPSDIKFKSSYAKSTLSKKLNLGLNFSTPSGGVTSPPLKGSMAQTYKL